MPTPLGHALAGLAIGWAAEGARGKAMTVRARWSLAITCAALAVFPDIDLVYRPMHRMMTHSLTAVVTAAMLMWLVQRRRHGDAWLLAAVCALAYGSHLLFDLLAGDTKRPAGIQLLWPFSDQWFISSWGIFRATTLGGFFRPHTIVSNALAVLQEIVLLTPLATAAFFWRQRRTGRQDV